MADVYKKSAVLLLNGVIVLACLELVSSGIGELTKSRVVDREPVDARSTSPYYTDKAWAAPYWREFKESRANRYTPYVLWRRAPFSGELINVDKNGLRATPGASCGLNSFKVFIFGASTTWGTGSPDWGTLPAYLQAGLQSRSGRPVCVMNFGESGYVSTQSLLQLILQIQAGNVPDLVISYEGLNDAFSAYQSGKVGAHENLDQLVESFERRGSVQQSEVARLMRSTSLFSVIEGLVKRVTHTVDAPPTLMTFRTMGIDETVLATSVAERYLSNYDIVDHLAQSYGFDFRFIWPPYISLGKKPLTETEKAIARGGVDPALDSLYRAVYLAVSAAAPKYPKLVDLTAIFDNESDLIWLDEMHVTPPGNRILAERIQQVLTHQKKKGT